MKTTKSFKRSFRTAAALMVATAMSVGFAACSDNDSANDTSTSQLVKDLTGTWHTSYSQSGSLTLQSGKTAYYGKAVQALTFNDDGTGTCYKFLCNYAGEPVSLFGGAGDAVNGRFHYTVGTDSVISITRDGDGNATNPKTWKLTFGTEGLNGTDGAESYQLLSADADWRAYITGLEEDYRSGANDDLTANSFLTDWQNCESVSLQGFAAKQQTPWSYKGANPDIADEIRFDVQKEAGWEMAFCELNDASNSGCHIFALYNRFTGTLRVFNYIPQPATGGYGNEFGMYFITDNSTSLPLYPFYNSMEYSIPICHDWNNSATFDRNVILSTNTSKYRPFETMLTPYTTTLDQTGVWAGWHCTDFDLSGYTEKEHNLINYPESKSTLMSINPYSNSTSQVKLAGSLIGNLEGEFTDPQYKKKISGNKTLSTVTGIFGALSSSGAGALNTANQTYSLLNNDVSYDELGGKFISALGFGALGLNLTACGLNIANQFAGKKEETVMVSPGTMSMTLDAKIDLEGTIAEWKSINDAGLRISPKFLNENSAHKDTVWMGSGCFGLAKDPVVYVSKEDLLSVSPSINIKAESDHYIAPSFPTDSVRLVSFVDPRSIEVCLNTDLYHDIDSVFVMVNYGVNANRELGHTDCYRNMLKLGERPTFSLMPTSGASRLTTATTPRLHVMTMPRSIRNDFNSNILLDSVKLGYQKGSVLPLYGRFESFMTKRLIMDPQVFVPYKNDSTIVYNVEVPDFVVTVTVAFKCRECPGGVMFSRPYIPDIKLIGHKDLATYYSDLKEYSDKCANKQPIATVHNSSNIKVYNTYGAKMLAKTLDILERCK